MTADKLHLSTVLVYGHLPEVIDSLQSIFDQVIFYDVQQFASDIEDQPQPTDEELARADVFLGFHMPPRVKDWKQTPRLKLFQGCSAGYTHITDSDYYKSIPKDADVIFASASGIHVLVAALSLVVRRGFD